VHADGLLKNEEIYNVFDTEKLLRRPIQLALTDKSGLAGIVLWVRQHVGPGEKRPLTKDHPGVRRIHEWMMEEYEKGRLTQITDREMTEQVRNHLAEWMDENGYAL